MTGSGDAKLDKLAAKIQANERLSGGNEILLAVPAKRGGLAAASLGAVSSTARAVNRDRSRGGVSRDSSAGRLLAMMGDGSDFVVCLTADAVRICRLVGFGVMPGKPSIVPNTMITSFTIDDGRAKDAFMNFTDGSALSFQVAKSSHRAILDAATAQLWPTSATA